MLLECGHINKQESSGCLELLATHAWIYVQGASVSFQESNGLLSSPRARMLLEPFSLLRVLQNGK